MEIILSKNAGFCPGVRRADIEIKKLISQKCEDERIFTLGKLIHNDSYVKELQDLGVRSITLEELEAILSDSKDSKISLVIRTHGVPLESRRPAAMGARADAGTPRQGHAAATLA